MSLNFPEQRHCFRGVHDDIINDYEVDSLIKVGGDLIIDGGDHVTIRNDTEILTQRAPIVLSKLELLLHEQYGVQGPLKPVAFRFHAAVSPLPNQLNPSNLMLERMLNPTVSQ